MKKLTIVAIVLLLLAACETRIIMPQPGEQSDTLSVQGSSEFEVAPDLARVRFRVETNSLTAQDAQNRNREVSTAVRSALLQSGVRENEVETTGYHVEKIQEWDPDTNRMVERGYRASNSFMVSIKDLLSVGKLLDVGVQAGANNVESISFELSDAREKEVKTEALHRAAQNAREKAVALAEGAAVSLGKVRSVQENSYYVTPYARYDVMEKVAMGAPSAPTPIAPGQVKVSAQVSVAYEVG
ncbi:SIMPL domain-containing protein [Candidatus Woesearchaeota archaeon]|nr:SIMPL domain-containing protein [Candidatus Woesearchaeota archaeon]